MQVLTLTKYIEEYYDGKTSEFTKDWGRQHMEPGQYLVITKCGYHRLVRVCAVKHRTIKA